VAYETLLDFFADFAACPGDFLIYDDGYRSWRYSYADVARAARLFAGKLRKAGIGSGEKVVIWSESRPEWVPALWGCLLEGVIVVPVDSLSSIELARRIHGIVRARVLLAGDDVPRADDLETWRLADLEWTGAPEAGAKPALSRDSIAEILFTSGTTAEPKGVVITHRNILANIVPVEREVRKYRGYGKAFFPIRFLNLLPLSHMFGQAMATFIPPMLPGVVLFLRGYNPQEIAAQIRKRRVSVLVSVPKILEVMRDYVLQAVPEAARVYHDKPHWLVRWWRYRRVHRLFGWKFWSFVVGAAPLDPELEEFWSRLGYIVIQGYGLTETAPIVTLNHPFHARKGTVGKPIAGVELRIADDGEILVRGENVTAGYFNAASETSREDGWFHTGDIGSVDAEGRLAVRGRKKEMIVTPEGLNVFPEDVERALGRQPGVRESAVVGQDRAHAVLVLDPGADAEAIVRAANTELEEPQRVRGFSIWPGETLPRTEGTCKLKRREVRQWVESGVAPRRADPAHKNLEEIVAGFAHGRAVDAGTTLAELGLSSLEKVELMMAIERQSGKSVDEGRFTAAHTVGELRAALEQPTVAQEPIDFPSWNRTSIARAFRAVSLATWILPIARIFLWVTAEGLENLEGIAGPVIFAANHQSHLDTPAILLALPRKWRYRLAPAMAKEFFKAHFFPREYGPWKWFTNSLNYYLSAMFFNAFPIPQRETGIRGTLRYAGELASEGACILIYPEGRRSENGEIGAFHPGVGILAARLELPVLPVRVRGVENVLRVGWNMARPGRVRVTFGKPITLRGEDYAALALQVQEALARL
jgi:long-chain acyl-CoA synthetase